MTANVADTAPLAVRLFTGINAPFHRITVIFLLIFLMVFAVFTPHALNIRGRRYFAVGFFRG